MMPLSDKVLGIAAIVKHFKPVDTWDYVLLDMAVQLRTNRRRRDEAMFYYLWWDSLPMPEVEWVD